MKALHLTRPHAIMLVGIPGSGKSYFATRFSDTFSTPYFDTIAIQKHVKTPEDAEMLTLHFLEQLVKTSQTFLFEGGSFSRARRSEFAAWARAHGYKPMFVWVQTDLSTSLGRALKAKSITKEEFNLYQQRFSPPHPDEKAVVISGHHTYAMQAKAVLSHLGRENREAAVPIRAPQRPAPAQAPAPVADPPEVRHRVRNISVQ